MSVVSVLLWIGLLHSWAHCQDPTLPHISVQPSGGIFADGSPPIILECVAEDADSIQWAHNEGIITSDPSRTIGSDNALTIVSLNGDLAGNYTCLASNEVGTVTSAIAEIELAVLQQSFHSGDANNPHEVVLTKGVPSAIDCGSVTSVPPASISWIIYDGFDGIDINPAADMAIEGLDGRLYFQNPGNSFNEETFECSAENRIGGSTVYGYVRVIVADPSPPEADEQPQPLSTPQDVTVNSADTMAEFDCIVGGTPLPVVEWTYPSSLDGDSRLRLSQNDAVLTVRNVQASDAGQYSCTTVGIDTFTGTLTLRDPPLISTPLPSFTQEIEYGNPLTLSCSASGLDITWLWYHNGLQINEALESTLIISGAVEEDSGIYQCFAYNPAGYDNSAALVTVNNPTITVSLEPNTTRLPTEPPYNTFTITCTATAPEGVVAGKTIEWRRRIGPSTTGLSEITDNGDTIQIETTGLNQPETISVLTVTETTPGDYRYRCRVDIAEIGINDVDGDVYPINVIGPVAPGKPTNLMNISTSFDLATVQWTVPLIAFTPETYVVHYGTNMGSLNVMSDPVESRDDFIAENQVYSVPITGLEAVTEYYYMVVSTSTGGTTNSDVESFTTPVGPDPPLNFMVTSPGQISLTFSWAAPVQTFGPLAHYTLNCDPVQPEGIPDPDPVMVDISVPPVTGIVTNLSPGVMYHCEVTATNDGGFEGRPAETDVTTLEAAPTGAPQFFTITTTTARSITFSWDPPLPTDRNGIIIYTLDCDPDDTNLPITVNSPQTDLTVSGFRPYTFYTCMVFATNSEGDGPAATIMYRTMEDAPEGSPLNFRDDVVPDVPESLSFMWLPPLESLRNGNITNYSIDCIPDNTSLTTVFHDGPITTAVVRGFTSGSRYTCFINASTSVGAGPSSEGLPVTTVPRPPENVTVFTLSVSELQVQWIPHSLQRIVSDYTIYITRMNGSEMSEVTTGRVSEYTVTGFNPFESVTIQVSANNNGGEGPRSGGVEGRTDEAPPGPVSNILWTRQTDTTAVVSWGPPEGPNGIITEYFIILTEYQGGDIILLLTVEHNVMSIEISDDSLVAGVPYTLTIRAANSAQDGDTNSINEFTRELIPSVVEGVMVDRTSGQQMTVSWTPLSLVEARGIIANYTVFITIGGGEVKRQNGGCTPDSSPCTVDSDQSSVTVTGLDPKQSYSVSVAAGTGAGAGQQSEPQMVPATATESDDSGDDATGVIAGGTVAGVVIVAAIVILLLILRHHRHAELPITSGEQLKMSEVAASHDPNITTSACEAYKAVKLGDQSHEYESLLIQNTAYGITRTAAPPTQQQPQTSTGQEYEVPSRSPPPLQDEGGRPNEYEIVDINN